MRLNWNRKGQQAVLEDVETDGVHYLSFPLLKSSNLVCHGFSTRIGGVSQGKYSSMNFTFTRGDNPEHVMENYRRMAKVLGVDKERMVLSYQTHRACLHLARNLHSYYSFSISCSQNCIMNR